MKLLDWFCKDDSAAKQAHDKTESDKAEETFHSTQQIRSHAAQKLTSANQRLAAIIAEIKKRETHDH